MSQILDLASKERKLDRHMGGVGGAGELRKAIGLIDDATLK